MFNSDFPWATALMAGLVAIAAVVGGAVVVWGPPGALSFESYLDSLKGFATAVGLLAVGRGVKAGIENHAVVNSGLTDAELLTDMPEEEAPAPKQSAHV